jgi:SAM-dependent methyltransferase
MFIVDAIGSRVASAWNRSADWLIERQLNIQTTGRADVDVADAVPYSTFAYWAIERVLDGLALSSGDVFVDLGCGKGRVVCAAARRSLRKCVGVDVDAALCNAARGNAARMRGGSRIAPIEIINLPAQEFDYSECTALFLFNPFGPGTLTAVMQSLIDSMRAAPRQVRIAYVNPRHDRCIAETGAFKQYAHWQCRPHGRLKFDVTFWESSADRS